MRALALTLTTVACIATTNVASAAAPKKPTFNEHVAPIFYKNCVNCHRAGDITPMSLITYKEVRPWAKSILKAVESGVMPPWHADEGIGHFSNERRLSDDERDTIVNWVNKGAKQGKPEDLPTAPTFDDDGWRLGEPDLVITFDEVDLDAGGPDQFYDLEASTGLTEDTWLQSVEVQPSNRKVAHHVIIWQQGNADQQRGWVGAWAAGMEPMRFPDNTGRLLTAGSSLVADMHYHPIDTAQTDQTSIGLYFAEDNKVEKELVNLWVQNPNFKIPAGNPNFAARATYTFLQDSYVINLLPHLHYRGKDFNYTARFPDGRKEKLLSVSKYDFNWQTSYELEEPLFVPKGTRIDCIAHWDNSADNPNNPDPTKDVTFGNESYDEMMIGFIDYVVKDGISPPSASELFEVYAQNLAERYPGEVYYTNVYDEADDSVQYTVSYLPTASDTGVLHLNANGTFLEATITELSWEGGRFEAVVNVVGQIYDFSGDIEPTTGKLTGIIVDRGNAENGGSVRGGRVE